MRGGRAGVRFAVGGAFAHAFRWPVVAVAGRVAVFSACRPASGAAARRRADPPCTLRRLQGCSDCFGVYRGNMSCCGSAHSPLGSCTSGGMHLAAAQLRALTARRSFHCPGVRGAIPVPAIRRGFRAQSLCDAGRGKTQVSIACLLPFTGRHSIAGRETRRVLATAILLPVVTDACARLRRAPASPLSCAADPFPPETVACLPPSAMSSHAHAAFRGDLRKAPAPCRASATTARRRRIDLLARRRPAADPSPRTIVAQEAAALPGHPRHCATTNPAPNCLCKAPSIALEKTETAELIEYRPASTPRRRPGAATSPDRGLYLPRSLSQRGIPVAGVRPRGSRCAAFHQRSRTRRGSARSMVAPSASPGVKERHGRAVQEGSPGDGKARIACAPRRRSCTPAFSPCSLDIFDAAAPVADDDLQLGYPQGSGSP